MVELFDKVWIYSIFCEVLSMKNLLQNKPLLKMILIFSIIFSIPVIYFLGIQFIFPIIILVLMYLFVTKVSYETIISPKEFEEQKSYLRDLEERAEMIREHLLDFNGDLQAKFELRELEKEMESVKEKMGL